MVSEFSFVSEGDNAVQVNVCIPPVHDEEEMWLSSKLF